MSQLLLTFYGDDFTGSTDALEQLTLAGIRTALFIEPPTPRQLKMFPGLQAVGVAGMTRSLAPKAMKRTLRSALQKLRALGAPHVHYKVCSTFDSSPEIGSIGCAIDVATSIFKAPFVPLLVAAPALGRHCVFGNLFARMGIGSDGAIHRLDRHPSISRHPITPMQEADLRRHLAKQTRRRIGLFDILKLALPSEAALSALKKIVAEGNRIVLFDALYPGQLAGIGAMLDHFASRRRPLFSVGSSGIEMALGAHWADGWGERTREPNASPAGRLARTLTPLAPVSPVKQLLVVSGSCSPVTAGQIRWALNNGFAGVAFDTPALATSRKRPQAMLAAVQATVRNLQSGRSVVIHTYRGGSDPRLVATARAFSRKGVDAAFAKALAAEFFGSMLAEIVKSAVALTGLRRLCVAGGDTSSYVARSLGIESLEMIAPLTPGAPLCRAHAAGSPVDGLEVVFKGGQVGAENCFEIVAGGRHK